MSTSTPIKKPISIGIDFIIIFIIMKIGIEVLDWKEKKNKSNPNPLIKNTWI